MKYPHLSIKSDVNNETQYWHIFKIIKNINKTDKSIERDVTLIAAPHQFVTVNPQQFVVEMISPKDPVIGTRVLTLSPSSQNNTK